LNKPIDEFNHLMDALRYAMEAFSIEQEYSSILLPIIGGWSLKGVKN